MTAVALLLPVDPAHRAAASYALVVTLGYGHLLGSLQPRQRLARWTPAGVSQRLFGCFLATSVASCLALYASALARLPWLGAPLLVVAVWHSVENDAALQEAYARRSLPGPLRLGAPTGLGLAVGTPLVAAWLGGAGGGGSQGLATAAFVLPTSYHLASWILFSRDRQRWLLRAGEIERARRLRRRLWVFHGLPIGIGAFLLLADAPAWVGLRQAFFSPPLYLFWSSLHVLDTALARRARVQRPACDPSRLPTAG